MTASSEGVEALYSLTSFASGQNTTWQFPPPKKRHFVFWFGKVLLKEVFSSIPDCVNGFEAPVCRVVIKHSSLGLN